MKIGIPKEVKISEGRVALTPNDIKQLTKNHTVYVENDAGLHSGYHNLEYQNAGAVIVDSKQQLYKQSKIIIKVKEPIEEDLKYLRSDHVLFCYLHLAANPLLLKTLLDLKLTAFAFETLTPGNYYFPLLAPMSDIAGKVSIQLAMHYLQNNNHGAGILLDEHSTVLIFGAGTAGLSAAYRASKLGCTVLLVDKENRAPPNVQTLKDFNIYFFPLNENLNKTSLIKEADVIITAAAIPGANSPKILTRDEIYDMLPNRVIVDISIDQGGCIEGIDEPTDWNSPAILYHDQTVIAVSNLPGCVPETSTQKLSNALIPYAVTFCDNVITNLNNVALDNYCDLKWRSSLAVHDGHIYQEQLKCIIQE